MNNRGDWATFKLNTIQVHVGAKWKCPVRLTSSTGNGDVGGLCRHATPPADVAIAEAFRSTGPSGPAPITSRGPNRIGTRPPGLEVRKWSGNARNRDIEDERESCYIVEWRFRNAAHRIVPGLEDRMSSAIHLTAAKHASSAVSADRPGVAAASSRRDGRFCSLFQAAVRRLEQLERDAAQRYSISR